MMTRFLIGAWLAGLWGTALCQSHDSLPRQRARVLLLPNLYYSPETRAGAGVAGVMIFRADSVCRKSSVDFGVLLTQRRQAILDMAANIVLAREQVLIKGIVHYAHFPDYFWGVGSDTPQEAREQVLTEYVRFHPQVYFRLRPRIYVGPQYQYYGAFRIQFDSMSRFMAGDFPGFHYSCTSGLGVNVLYDTRNNLMYPRTGTMIEAGAIWYRPLLGSTHRFTAARIDARTYLAVGKQAVIAVQGLAQLHFGEVPFIQMAAIGGGSLGRGYYQGRFRDRHLLALQTEYRQLFGRSRWGGVAFAGCAAIAPALKDFSRPILRYNAGVGLRFRLSANEPINIRADAGFGKNTAGFYGNIGEAF